MNSSLLATIIIVLIILVIATIVCCTRGGVLIQFRKTIIYKITGGKKFTGVENHANVSNLVSLIEATNEGHAHKHVEETKE